MTADVTAENVDAEAPIKDRIYGSYFTARLMADPAALPKLTKVVFANKLSIPLLVYVSTRPDRADDSYPEDHDWFHPDTPDQQLEVLLDKGQLAAGATITIDNPVMVKLFPNVQVKVLSAATLGVLGFWTLSPSAVSAAGVLTIALDETLMRAPNGIGEPPVPKATAPAPRGIPRNSSSGSGVFRSRRITSSGSSTGGKARPHTVSPQARTRRSFTTSLPA
jgi:hypothetical protein